MRNVAFALTLFAASTCKKPETPAQPPTTAPVVRTRQKAPLVPVELATPTVIDEATPARFSTPPPASEEALRGALEAELFHARLEKSESLRAQVLAALEKSVRGGAVSPAVERYYTNVFGYAPAPGVCDWLALSVRRASKAIRPTLLRGLSGCQRVEDAAVFEAEASDETYVDWCFRLEKEERLAFSKRPVVAAQRLMTSKPPGALRGIGFCLAKMDGPVRNEVTALMAGPGDDEHKATATLGLLRAADPALISVGRKACDVLRDDPMCEQFLPAEERSRGGLFSGARDAPPADAGVNEVIAYFGADSDEVRARFGAVVAAKALTTCARRGDERAAMCLRTLARVDRPAAVKLLESHGARLRKKPDGVGLLVRTMLAYPDGGVQARLVADGLLPASTSPRESTDITADWILEESGCVHSFDVETGMFPNQHHVMLTELALRTPTLRDAVFDEVAPDEDAEERGPYELRAWLGGKRYSVTAKNNGDWYDLPAMLGLLNALLVAQHSNERFITFPSSGQLVSVFVAPLPVLEALVNDGLLEVGEPDDAMRIAKGFEERVLRQLGDVE